MKLKRKHYPLACIICLIVVIAFSAINSYKIKEGFIETIKTFTNNNRRKLTNFKNDVTQLGGQGMHSIKKLFRS